MLTRSKARPVLSADPRYVYAEWLRALDGASGVYAIWDRGACLYVGESHSGRLYGTITRHFQHWRRSPDDAYGRRRGGTQYAADGVVVAVQLTHPSEAADVQFDAIARLRPLDNQVTGYTVEDQ